LVLVCAFPTRNSFDLLLPCRRDRRWGVDKILISPTRLYCHHAACLHSPVPTTFVQIQHPGFNFPLAFLLFF
jgi:uncharacterized metal-binding protein